MLTFCSAVDYAGAACQAYRSDPAFLADLEKGDFIARVFPSAPPQTPEQKQKLKAIARENSPGQIGELAQLEGFWRQSTGAPLPFPITMSAPFQLDIRVGSYPILDPVKVEFDADGDGKPELVQEVAKTGNSFSYTYKQEGNYEYVVRIHDRSGKIHTYKTRLHILSQARSMANFKRSGVNSGKRCAAATRLQLWTASTRGPGIATARPWQLSLI